MAAQSEGRLIVSEDFDFGELLVRRRLSAPGAIILHLPGRTQAQRAARLQAVLALDGLILVGDYLSLRNGVSARDCWKRVHERRYLHGYEPRTAIFWTQRVEFLDRS